MVWLGRYSCCRLLYPQLYICSWLCRKYLVVFEGWSFLMPYLFHSILWMPKSSCSPASGLLHCQLHQIIVCCLQTFLMETYRLSACIEIWNNKTMFGQYTLYRLQGICLGLSKINSAYTVSSDIGYMLGVMMSTLLITDMQLSHYCADK